MDLIFERGERSSPRGHALVYFRNARNPDEVWATYVVVPPIAMDLAKYMPPMFASQLPTQMPSGPTAYPLPPLPEQAASFAWLEHMARARNDDLLAGGSIDPGDLQRMMMAVAEVAQRYGGLYAEWAARAPEPEPAREPEPLAEMDVDELLFSLSGDRDKIGKLAKLVGTLRYAMEGGDRATVSETVAEMERLGRHLDEKYRASALIEAARRPGEQGWRLAQLYVERAYKIADEEYAAVGEIEARIRGLERA